MRLRPKLTYANVVATLALFFAITGGAVYAANKIKIRSNDIAARAVKRGKLAPGAVGASQLADGAVGTNQIADGAVVRSKIAPNAVGGGQIEDESIGRADLKDPVGFVASTSGGSASVANANGDVYPLNGGIWVAAAGEFDVVFGQVEATLEAEEGSQCNVMYHLYLNGQEAGGTYLQSGSSTPEHIRSGIGGEPKINFDHPTDQALTASLSSNNCAPGSTINGTQIRVLGIG